MTIDAESAIVDLVSLQGPYCLIIVPLFPDLSSRMLVGKAVTIMQVLRTEFRQYSQICEQLLVLAGHDATISEEEEDVLIHYASALWKAFHTVKDA
jgi:hypothetical protein